MDTTPTTTEITEITESFFAGYEAALLAFDAVAVADHYAVPALVLFPGQAIAVSDRAQTEQFFASAWEQYHGVTSARRETKVLAATDHAIWADVRWSYPSAEPERFCYQLARVGEDWKVAVLTPLPIA